MKNKSVDSKVNFFTTVYESIVKISKYPLWARQPLGKAIVYLLMLAFLGSLFSAVPSSVYFSKDLDKTLLQLESELPDFSIKDNLLTVSDNKVHTVTVNEALTIIMDPSGNANTDKLPKTGIGIYVYKNGYNVQFASMMFPFSYSDYGVLNKTKAEILDMARLLKLESILIFIFGVLFSIISKFIHALFLGLLAMLFSRTARDELSFGHGFKMACYALTLPVILEIFANLLGIYGDGFSIVYHLTAAVYQFMAFNSVANNEDL